MPDSQLPAGAAQATSAGPRIIPFGTGWLFGRAAAGSDQPGFDDNALATVTLPHTVAPLSWQNWDPSSWEAVWVYRKHFDAPADVTGMRVFLDFAAAMTHSTVTLNGTRVADHLGGYLPFSAEITGQLQPRGNVLAVTLDSTFNLDVPPDRPAPSASRSVDFWQPGGIYRDVSLRIVPQVFLADVFAKPVNVLDASTRQLVVQATVDAAAVPAGSIGLTVDLTDGTPTVASATVPVTISAAGQMTVTATLTGLAEITLWDIANPKLYTVRARLTAGGSPVHDYQVSTGFREAAFQLDGFYLNGDRVKLFGVNRHELFPYAGGAMPARVQAKDAAILRNELNCNIVRCSHYPQSADFYDACDELGLMVWAEIPGWGYFGDAAWQQAASQDVHDMIIRDRNHPAIVVWGAMPNEAGEHATEFTQYNNLAHSLDDSRPTGGDGSVTDASFVFDVYSNHDYSYLTGPGGVREPTLVPPVDAAGKPYLVCETIGALSGPAGFYRRTDSQIVQQGQATAHATVHNIAASDDRYCGVLTWAGFDYPSGLGNGYQGVKYVGVVDLFRILKPGAAIYQAQADPKVRPVIAPAFYWDLGPTSPVTSLGSAMICSNLEQLQVYVGGQPLATVTPDTTGYGHLDYPPSLVDFSAVDTGTVKPDLRIDGYLGGVKVASQSFAGDPSGDRLSLVGDDAEIDGDGVDATRVMLRAVDKYGAPRPYVSGPVTLTVDGPGVLIGDNPVDFGATGGAAAVWIRSLPGSPGVVTVKATHAVLGSAVMQVKVGASAGPAVPYGSLTVTAATGLVGPGGTTTVTATLVNHGLPTLDKVTFMPTLLPGWTAIAAGMPSAAGATGVPSAAGVAGMPSGAGVRSGQSATESWQVTAPASAGLGQFPVTVQAVYTAGAQRGVTYADATVQLRAYASLAAAFNNAGISDDSAVTAANFDGVGNSYSAQALAAAGLGQGAAVTHDGITFTWPSAPPGQPDNVIAQRQTILLSGSGGTLGFLGAGSPGNATGTGTVHYTDGSTSSFTITLDDYFAAPSAGNDVIATLPYLNDSDPATAGGTGGAGGKRNQTVYVFYTSAGITPGKTVQAVTLPGGGSIPAGGGRISGLHIFAFGIGPVAEQTGTA